jgi:hypothetical protein
MTSWIYINNNSVKLHNLNVLINLWDWRYVCWTTSRLAFQIFIIITIPHGDLKWIVMLILGLISMWLIFTSSCWVVSLILIFWFKVDKQISEYSKEFESVIKGGISVWSSIKTCHIIVLKLDKIVNDLIHPMNFLIPMF